MLDEFIGKKTLLQKEFIREIANTASFRYKKFTIKKKNGKERIIYQPSKELKTVQRIVLEDILVKFPTHVKCFAYKKGQNCASAVNVHLKNKYFIRIDFKDFFYSFTKNIVRSFYEINLPLYYPSINNEDVELLTNISCFHNNLVIGSVVSPALTNAICYALDEKVDNYCIGKGIEYSRYSDDMLFSTSQKDILFSLPNQLQKLLLDNDEYSYLRINFKKTYHSSHKRNIKLLGITITNDNKKSIGHKNKRIIRSKIFTWDTLDNDEKIKVQGLLAYYRDIEPTLINRLCLKYGSDKINSIITYSISQMQSSDN